MRVVNEVILSAGDASGDLNSSALYLDQMFGFAMAAVITGAPVGSLKLQGSVAYGPRSNALTADGTTIPDWNDISGSTQAVTGAGEVTWNFNGTFYKWVRVVYTSTSGTGAITVTANAKGV